MTHASQHPLYQKIKEDILEQIKGSLLKPGDKLPTEYQLMQQYHVSRITVSKAINELKNEGVVVRFPNKGTFVSDSAVFSSFVKEEPVEETIPPLPDSITKIACIIPAFEDMFTLSMINGVLSVFPTDSYICHILPSSNPTMENYLLQECLESNMAGIVLFPQNHPFFSDQLLTIQLQKYPMILLDRYLPRLDTNYVIADNQAAGALCLNHLYNLGHQRIAFITDSDRETFTIKHRLKGIMETARSLNIPQQSISILEGIDIRKKFSYYQNIFSRLILQNRVTAFIAAESNVCSYLYDLFTYMGFRVPDNISLISFDRPVNKHRNPDFFTYIDQSEYLMGREAGRMLKNRLEENNMTVHHRVITPTLRIHESTRSILL